MIDISNMNKAEVLARLYNGSRSSRAGQTLGLRREEMTVEEAQELLDEGSLRFDYVKGRSLKVNLSGDVFSPAAYDRDNGEGAAAKALS